MRRHPHPITDALYAPVDDRLDAELASRCNRIRGRTESEYRAGRPDLELAHVAQFRDQRIGHPHFQIGVASPLDEAAETAARRSCAAPRLNVIEYTQFVFDAGQNHVGVFRAYLRVNVEEGGATFSGSARVRFSDVNGVLLFEGLGTVSGRRMTGD